MHLPRSILYPLVGLFILGGICFHALKGVFLLLFPVLLLFLIVGYYSLKKNFKTVKSLLLYTVFFCVGYLNFQAYYTLSDSHYLRVKSDKKILLKKIKILEKRHESSFSYSYVGELLQMGDLTTTGRVLIHQKKDSLQLSFVRGQIILTSAALESITGVRNPGAFSYKAYLENQAIYNRIELNPKNYYSLRFPKNKLRNRLDQYYDKAKRKIQTSQLNEQSKAMLQALLLAERSSLGSEQINQYAKAGILHLLALSGLHIGLIVELLLIVLSPLRRVRFGTTIRLCFVLCLLWIFALFVGLPASVVRAVTLFSFFTIGRFMNQGKNSFHLTVVSLLLLLVVHPPFLREIGFQFSFLAVLGILWIQPILQKFYSPKQYLIKKIWGWITVCLAAQIAVGPISVFYFHQFPSLFLFSNVLIVPFFGIFLGLTIAVFALLLAGILPTIIRALFDAAVSLLNTTVGWIAENDPFDWEGLFFPLSYTLTVYILLFSVVLLMEKRKFKNLLGVLLSISTLLFFIQTEYEKTKKEDAFWIFHQHQESLYGHLKKGILYYKSSHPNKAKSVIYDFKASQLLFGMADFEIQNIYLHPNMKLLILADDQPFELSHLKPTHILLQKNPKINLDRLLATYQPKMIVADGSNSPWFVNRWEESCTKKGVSFYDTRKKGALKINL